MSDFLKQEYDKWLLLKKKLNELKKSNQKIRKEFADASTKLSKAVSEEVILQMEVKQAYKDYSQAHWDVTQGNDEEYDFERNN